MAEQEQVQVEEWTAIPGFNSYQINKKGEIRKILEDGRINIPALKLESGSYKTYLTNNEHTRNNFTVQKYMAITFLQFAKNDDRDIEHINGNRQDNRLENLRIADPKPEKVVENPRGYGTTSKRIWRLDPITEEKIQLYDSYKEAIQWAINNVQGININGKVENFINTNTAKIKNAINDNKTHFNFKWELDNNYEDLDGEEWRNIPPAIIGNIQNFQVSNCGRIRGGNKKPTMGYINSNNTYSTDIGGHDRTIHNIVAVVFLNADNKDIIHKDGNKLNNRVENLELVNKTCNINNARKITQYDLNLNPIESFNSITEAANKLNIPNRSISACCLGEKNETDGFIFKYD
jgi:hypothetical protein